MTTPTATTRQQPSVSPLSSTDGYVFDQGGYSWDELAELIPVLHGRLFGLDPAGWTVRFRHASAPKLVGGGTRTGYTLLPRPQGV